MSMAGGRQRGRADAVGDTVARYPEYEAAQKAVSRLIAGDVPARDIAIVGIGLRSIERVTGRLGYATAARSGAINGLLLGLLFSAFLVLGSPSVPVQAFIGVMFVGIALGMLLSIITYSFVRRRRDFASAMQVVADHYDVTVASGSIAKARQVLGAPVVPPTVPRPGAGSPGAQAPEPGRAPAPSHDEPPRYGERIAPAADPGAAAAGAQEQAEGEASTPASADEHVPSADDEQPDRHAAGDSPSNRDGSGEPSDGTPRG